MAPKQPLLLHVRNELFCVHRCEPIATQQKAAPLPTCAETNANSITLQLPVLAGAVLGAGEGCGRQACMVGLRVWGAHGWAYACTLCCHAVGGSSQSWSWVLRASRGRWWCRLVLPSIVV